MVRYRGAKIQLLDLPGIIEGAKDGKGRGRQVCAPIIIRLPGEHALRLRSVLLWCLSAQQYMCCKRLSFLCEAGI